MGERSARAENALRVLVAGLVAGSVIVIGAPSTSWTQSFAITLPLALGVDSRLTQIPCSIGSCTSCFAVRPDACTRSKIARQWK